MFVRKLYSKKTRIPFCKAGRVSGWVYFRARGFPQSAIGSVVTFGEPDLAFLLEKWRFCFTSPVHGRKLRSSIVFLSPAFTSPFCHSQANFRCKQLSCKTHICKMCTRQGFHLQKNRNEWTRKRTCHPTSQLTEVK